MAIAARAACIARRTRCSCAVTHRPRASCRSRTSRHSASCRISGSSWTRSSGPAHSVACWRGCPLAPSSRRTRTPLRISRRRVRIHIPVFTHDAIWMVCAGRSYRMKPGEAWALNNNAVHAVWNAHDSLSRTHLICDFVPSARLLELLQRSERELGEVRPEVDAQGAGGAAARRRDGMIATDRVRLPASAQVGRHVRQRMPAQVRARRAAARLSPAPRHDSRRARDNCRYSASCAIRGRTTSRGMRSRRRGRSRTRCSAC